MREVGRGPYGNVGHAGEQFWRRAAVLQQPWGSGAKLGTTDGRVVVKGLCFCLKQKDVRPRTEITFTI